MGHDRPDWLDVVVDARPIQAIYGERVPLLISVVLHEVSLHRDGPRVIVRFDLPEFPVNPPRKWVAQQFNVAQLKLIFDGIHDISLQGWSTNPVVDISIIRAGDRVKASVSSAAVQINIDCDAVLVSSISGYQSR